MTHWVNCEGRYQSGLHLFVHDFSILSTLRVDFAYLLFLLNIISSRSDLLVASSIGIRWYWDPFKIRSNILLFSSWWLNSFEISEGPRILNHSLVRLLFGVLLRHSKLCWRRSIFLSCEEQLLVLAWKRRLGSWNIWLAYWGCFWLLSPAMTFLW